MAVVTCTVVCALDVGFTLGVTSVEVVGSVFAGVVGF